MQQVVLATGNKGKVREFRQLLSNQPFEIIPQSEFDVSEVAETGLTFVENAIIKARHAAKITGLPAIADDSGIEVDALAGAPGIYSARYAGEDASDRDNLYKLIKDVENVERPNRTARFQCVLVFMRHADDPTPIVCQASWEGTLLSDPQGENGFGYDPIFWLEANECTSAELAPDIKDKLSHRGQALRKLVDELEATDFLNTLSSLQSHK
ncbi:MAG: non-canonical purine NTP pyrophosphatase, RdgB/HAM1 family [Gammaproteobacteria bacterium]|nr:MAG: non-canonical purine NTP pyrophosphatase, RdgB/HAM1 family [Gammaproteobacteria bacterium]